MSPSSTGWTRRRAGRGFVYLDPDGRRLSDEDVVRCRQLVIPPAWQEVWICPHPRGHIQAVGTDDAGRRQYLYHPDWRIKADRDKHERVLLVARRLPRARERAAVDLGVEGMPRERALATAFRLLDLGFFRVGGEAYAEEHGSYGLATMERQHLRISNGVASFDFVAKSGLQQSIEVYDEAVIDALRTLRKRRGGGPDLLAYKKSGRWRDVTSDDVNEYVKQILSADATAKDFRTWHATVLAAVALAVSTHASETPTARKRAVARAMREVAEYLGNTPAVARRSYVDPRVIDLYEDGITIEPALRRLGADTDEGSPATHGNIERAVLRMLRSADTKGRARRHR